MHEVAVNVEKVGVLQEEGNDRRYPNLADKGAGSILFKIGKKSPDLQANAPICSQIRSVPHRTVDALPCLRTHTVPHRPLSPQKQSGR